MTLSEKGLVFPQKLVNIKNGREIAKNVVTVIYNFLE